MKNALAVLGQSIEEGRVIDRPDLLVPFGELNDLMGVGRSGHWNVLSPPPGAPERGGGEVMRISSALSAS